MKNKKWIQLIGFILIIIISNISPIHEIIKLFLDNNHYKYSSSNGEFTFVEFKTHDTATLYRRFKNYKENSNDPSLFRLFSKNPLAFWRYTDYINDPKYNLPYKNWKEIKKLRGYELKNSNNRQDF